MNNPVTHPPLSPSLTVLTQLLTQLSEHYLQLLHQPESLALCREAGRSLRAVADQYGGVLTTAMTFMDSEEEDDDSASLVDEDDQQAEVD